MVNAFNLLVMAPNSWLGQWVNRQQLFSRLGRIHHVVYATNGWFTWDRGSTSWLEAPWLGSFAQHDNVWVDVSPRLLMRTPRVPLMDQVVLRLQVWRWRRFLRQRGSGPFVAYIFHPMFLPYVDLLGANHVVYHAYDLYDHTPGWNSQLEQAELKLLRTADMVIAASDQIADALRSKVAREIRVLPNGADVEAFGWALGASSPEPADLAEIPHPRLGWVGSLHPQVNYGLIADIARRRPDWHFVLVGQVVAHTDAQSDAERTDCASLSNVHFLGKKPIDDIPSYVANMDVNLMIYRLSKQSWITAGYPLKLHEYLATGLPVVSADLPSVRPFSKVVHIVDTADEWLMAIDAALPPNGGRGSRDERLAVANANSWNQRVQTLNGWLSDITKTSKK